jgi:tetratricopeptide (TPR) repeat protein
MLQNHDAYRNWADAKEIFHQLEAYFQRFQKGKSWYKIPIQRMEANCAARPEEIWTWLNYFERSNLRPPTQQVVECVQEKIREQAYSNVYALMQDLQEANKRCEEVHEMAEIYLEFGLAAYQLGNNYFAIDLLGNAVQNFYPGIGSYHKEVVARCMLGAVEWLQKPSNSQAAGHWLHCIEEFENLRGLADRDCLQEKEQWYVQHRNFLWAALLEQRKQNPKPLDPDSHIPEEDGPQPASSTPNGRKTNTYHDLLIEVKWDRAIADRLIEFERKKSPAADRNELINRSIERLLRDRI